MKTIYLAGGCFWGRQKYFDQFPGVTETEAGYANGPDAAPTYQEVCADSGHAETVRVVYDEKIISLEELLEKYFLVIDPLAVNQQGHDRGIQYRTGIYYTDDSQLPAVRKAYAAQEARVGDNGTAHALAERYLAEYRENRQTAEDGTLLLDCGGLSLSQVLYFISEGMPVCAFTDDDHYLLIPGYDRFSNVMVVHNPGTEEMFEELLGINDSNAFFDALGNDFVCFLKQ